MILDETLVEIEASPAETGVRGWLARRPKAVLTVWAMCAAFSAYGSMYAFRKPFTAAPYPGLYWGFEYKVILVVLQLVGYTLSKFLGIKFVSEAPAGRRSAMVLGLIGFAELSLVLFAIVPAPWNVIFLFLNGLPLGMIWGLIFTFLEGRRVTEFLGLGLSLSLIFASGWTRAVGKYLLDAGQVSPFWMPALTGALFLPLLFLALWMLASLPRPDAVDVALRSRRQPMDRDARHAFLRQHWPGVVLLVAGYMGLMTYRDLRDNFQIDILKEFGVNPTPEQLVRIENIVGLAVIASLGFFALFKKNRHAYFAACGVVAFGALLVGVATWLQQAGHLGPLTWMTLVGIGLYAGFIPYQAILFERLLAMLRAAGTVAFLIAMCDSYGYLSTITLYFYKEFGAATVSWGRLIVVAGYALAIVVPVLMLGGALAFAWTKEHPES